MLKMLDSFQRASAFFFNDWVQSADALPDVSLPVLDVLEDVSELSSLTWTSSHFGYSICKLRAKHRTHFTYKCVRSSFSMVLS